MRAADGFDRIFYDGECGFCHRGMRFFAMRDRDGSRFRFSPKQGETYPKFVSEETRVTLPESIVVLTPDGRVLTRSTATSRMLRRLGGFWGLVGCLLWLCPWFLRDWGYMFVARIRKKLLPKPDGPCPILPPEQRARFDP